MSDSLTPNQVITATVRIFDERGGSLEVPKRRFQVLKKIGSGAMAVVYEAVQLDVSADHPDRLVAVKVFNAERMVVANNNDEDDSFEIVEGETDEEITEKKKKAEESRSKKQKAIEDVLQRFRQEFEIQSATRHENITRVIGWGEVDACPFFVLERIQGIGLDRRIKKRCDELGRLNSAISDGESIRRQYYMDELEGRLEDEPVIPLSEFYRIAIGITHALELLHFQQIVHRDIKPSNIMILGEGQAKVLDFGISKVLDIQKRKSFGVNATLTEMSWFLGTPVYVAPEIIVNARNVSPRVDVYATGIVMFEMLTGCKARIEGESDILRRILDEPEVYDIARYFRNASEPLRLVILKATQQNPNHRYADGGQLRYALEEALAGRIASFEFAETQQRVIDPEIVEQVLENLPTRVYRPSIVEIVSQKAQATARIGRKAIIMIAGSGIVIGGLGTAGYLSYAIQQGEDRALVESTQQSVQSLATSVTNSVVGFVRGEDASVQTLPEPLPSATVVAEVPVVKLMNSIQLASFNAGSKIVKSNPEKALGIFLSLKSDGVRDERLLDAIASLEKRLGKTTKKKKPLN